MAQPRRIERLSERPGRCFALFATRPRRFGFLWHDHLHCELMTIEQGRLAYQVGDRSGILHPGQLILCGPRLAHAFYTVPGEEIAEGACRFAMFDPALLGDDLLPECSELRHLAVGAARGLLFGDVGRLPHSEGLGGLVELLRLLGGLRGGTELASAGWQPRANHDERLDDIMRHLHREATTLRDLRPVAAAAGLSVPALVRLVRRHTGITPGVHLTEARIALACRMLLETDRPITAIALEVGFESLSGFHRAFTSRHGCSAARYRQSARAAPRTA